MITIDEQKFRRSYGDRTRRTHGVSAVLLKRENASFRDLADRLTSRLARLCDQLGIADLVEIYNDSIHATIIGLEGWLDDKSGVVNENMIARLAGITAPHPVPGVDLKGLLEYFRQACLPLHIQIGGVKPDDLNPYDPDRRPFERTFSLRDDGLLVMIGWPVVPKQRRFAPVPTLLGIRKYLERFNVVHKYHKSPSDQDNDLFVVLGSLNYVNWHKTWHGEQKNVLKKLDHLVNEMRVDFSNPYYIEADERDVWVVEYLRTTLAEQRFCKRVVDCTEQELRELYQ